MNQINTQSMVLQQMCCLYVNSKEPYKKSKYFNKIYNTYKNVFEMNTNVVCVSYVKEFVNNVFEFGDQEQIHKLMFIVNNAKNKNENYISNKFISYVIDNIDEKYSDMFYDITHIKIKRG